MDSPLKMKFTRMNFFFYRNVKMRPYVFHLMFLLLFGFFNMHVQVSKVVLIPSVVIIIFHN